MSRQTWKKGLLHISYGNPQITPFHHYDETPKQVKGIDDIMYFYYDVSVVKKNKVIASWQTHDFPKVHILPSIINEIMTFDMNKAYLMEDIKEGGFERQVRYTQLLADDWGIEYFYKLERYDYSVKQYDENEPTLWTEYVLTIGQTRENTSPDGRDGIDFGQVIMINRLTPDDLLSLKKTALRFCKEAIRLYNEDPEV